MPDRKKPAAMRAFSFIDVRGYRHLPQHSRRGLEQQSQAARDAESVPRGARVEVHDDVPVE